MPPPKRVSFFKAFAKVHPEKNFPTVSLLVLGALAFVFSLLFRLAEVITAILAMRILIQFVGQAIGLMLLHRKKQHLPFRMPGYPLPVILVIGIWFFILISTGLSFILSGLAVTALGTCSYLVISYRKKHWPF
jgi:amino acid transporter